MPFVDVNQLGKVGSNLVVRAEMFGFTASRPAAVQWRQYGLADVFENFRDTRRQVVIQQNYARREAICEMYTLAGTQ